MKLLRLILLALLAAGMLLPVMVEAEKEVISVRVIFPEKQHTVATTARTVEGFLAEQGLKQDDFERVFPAPQAGISAGAHIFLYPAEAKQDRGSSVEYSTRTIQTNALPSGHTLAIRGGRYGEKSGERLKTEPVSRVELEGQADFKVDQLSRLRQQGSMRLMATGYSTHPLDTAPYDDGYSALGLPAGYGIAAVDPRVIPLGTLLYVEGYGYAIAADVGSAIKGEKIDLCFPSRRQALLFGRQYTTVHILG